MHGGHSEKVADRLRRSNRNEVDKAKAKSASGLTGKPLPIKTGKFKADLVFRNSLAVIALAEVFL